MNILQLGVLSIVTASSGESPRDTFFNRLTNSVSLANLVSLVKNFEITGENLNRAVQAVEDYERHLQVHNPVEANKIEEWKNCYRQNFEILTEVTLENILEIKTQCNQKLPDSIDRESFEETIGNFTKIQVPINNFKEQVLRKKQLHELVRIYSFFNGKQESTIIAFENFYKAADLAIRELDLTAWKKFWNDSYPYGYSAFKNNQSWFSHLSVYEKVQQIDNYHEHFTRFSTCILYEIGPSLLSHFQQQSNATSSQSWKQQAFDFFSSFTSFDKPDTNNPYQNLQISLDNAENVILKGLECSKVITNAIVAQNPEIHSIRKPDLTRLSMLLTSADMFLELTTTAMTTSSYLSYSKKYKGNGTWFGMSINKLLLFIIVSVMIGIAYALLNHQRW